MKTLNCSDAGFDCKHVVRAQTAEEVLQQADANALKVHGVNVTPEQGAPIAALIRDEAPEEQS